MRISEKHVDQLDYYLESDAKAFRMFLGLLQSLGYFLDKDLGKLAVLFQTPVEKLIWKVDERALKSWDTKRYLIPGHEVVHQGMHALIAKRFTSEYRGFILTTLMGEAAAGALQTYFEICRISALKKIDTQSPIMSKYLKSSWVLRKPLKPLLERALDDPFESYKKTVLAELKICELLLKFQTHTNRKNRNLQLRELTCEIRKVENAVFILHKDYGNFLSFVSGNCGSNSRPADQRHYEEWVALLNGSTSMTDFLKKLGIQRWIGSTHRKAA